MDYRTGQILDTIKQTGLKEERDVGAYYTWVADPMLKIIGEFEASLRKYPPIKLGTPDPYTPPQ
jgi:arylsulfatase